MMDISWFMRKNPSEETITIYMRSGHTIVLDRVTDWEIGPDQIRLEFHKKAKCKLLANMLKFEDIVAVTRSPA